MSNDAYGLTGSSFSATGDFDFAWPLVELSDTGDSHGMTLMGACQNAAF